MKKKGCLIIVAIVFLISILLVIAAYRVFFIPSGISIDKKEFPITGIDISQHTGEIDFDILLPQKIDFVYI